MQNAINKITSALALALVISLGVSIALETAELTYNHLDRATAQTTIIQSIH